MNLFFLGLAWVFWCLLHSLLIHPPIERRLKRMLGVWQNAFRLLYNLFALVSLVPVGMIYWTADSTPVLIWPDWLHPLQWLCWLAAAYLVLAAARVYDTASFLGTRQLRQQDPGGVVSNASNDSGLQMNGVLRYSRHPWYLAGLILLWSRSLTARELLTSILLTLYLLIGMVLEERKLVREFGRAYRDYQRQVPMLWRFFPRAKR